LDNTIKVAVVRSDRRRGAVAEAFALIADDVRRCVPADSSPVIVPNLDNPARPWTCTHRDTLSAATDAILGAGASSIMIAAGTGRRSHPTCDQFDRLGYRGELWNRPATFLDLDADADSGQGDGPWTTIRWINPRGEPVPLRICSRVAAARCRVALGVARTHGLYRVGLGLTDLTGVFHPDDGCLPGQERGRGGGLPRVLSRAAPVVEAWRGGMVRAWLVLRSIAGGMRLTGPERRRLEWVEQATSSLVALAALIKPRVSLIDGFAAMEGEGPRYGRRLALGTVIAGTDPVAVDAVAASIMGFEPREIAYLRQAEINGLGTADLAAITIVGDPVSASRHRFRRHSSDRLLQLVSSTTARERGAPRPHFGSVPTRSQPGRVGRTK
jgi:uncharacterized protein (DUF362 family)